jgi:hypothetical protein
MPVISISHATAPGGCETIAANHTSKPSMASRFHVAFGPSIGPRGLGAGRLARKGNGMGCAAGGISSSR